MDNAHGLRLRPQVDRALMTRYEAEPDVVYLVDQTDHLVWCNAAWDKFAEENGARELTRASQAGRPLMAAICEDLRDFYRAAFEQVRRDQKEMGHIYECSSPETLRVYHMRMLPMPGGAVLMTHSLVSSEANEEPAAGQANEYPDEHGLIRMCAHCRRTLRPSIGIWEWMPKFVEKLPEKVSHGLCGFCRTYHYPSRGLL